MSQKVQTASTDGVAKNSAWILTWWNKIRKELCLDCTLVLRGTNTNQEVHKITGVLSPGWLQSDFQAARFIIITFKRGRGLPRNTRGDFGKSNLQCLHAIWMWLGTGWRKRLNLNCDFPLHFRPLTLYKVDLISGVLIGSRSKPCKMCWLASLHFNPVPATEVK